MDRKGMCWILAVIMAAGLASPVVADSPEAHEEMVRSVLEETPLIDGHNDAPWAIRSRWSNQLAAFDFHDTGSADRPMHTDLGRLEQGGVGGQIWSVWVPTSLEGGEAVATVLEQIDVVHRLIDRYPDALELALTADDIRRIHKAGKIASMIGVEGGHSINESIAVLRSMYALGARSMSLTHWQNVSWCDAATDKPALHGISPFGLKVVGEMNRLGMMVDLSHVSVEVMHQVLDSTRAPVIFSHSSAFALNPHPRNVPDDVLRRVTENGGIVMVNFGSFFLSEATTHWAAEREAEQERLDMLHPGDPDRVKTELELWKEAHPQPAVPLSVLADHIEHIRRVAGVDHVGLGSDFDGVGSLPEGMGDVTGYPALLVELARRGWTRDELAKVAGTNILRVMDEVERVAADLRTRRRPEEARFEPLAAEPH